MQHSQPHTIISQLMQSNHHQPQQQMQQVVYVTSQPMSIPPPQQQTMHLHVPSQQQMHHQQTMSHSAPQQYSLLAPPSSSSSRQPHQFSSSSFSSPAGSTSSSPYLSPSLSSNASTTSHASTLALSQSLESMLGIGSRIQVRGASFIHPKLQQYAHTQAEIVQLPAHPNTWYGVRLNDGKCVKLRKSAFELAMPNNSTSTTSSPTLHSQQYGVATYSPPQGPQPVQQQQYGAQFQFGAYGAQLQHYNSYAHQANSFPQTQPQQKIAYTGPSPSPSPVPMNVPTLAQLQLTTPQLSSSPQPVNVKNSPSSAPLQSQSVSDEDDLDLNSTTAKSQVKQQEDYTTEDEQPPEREEREGKSDVQMHDASQSQAPALNSKRKPAPRTVSPEGSIDGVGEDDDDDEDVDEADMAMEDDDDEEDDSHSFAGKRRKPNGAKGSKSAPGSGTGGSKAARQRRGRGRALLGLNVVITNGRYKGETGLVVRGANGYYSVKFHKSISELRAHDNTAMKRSSELAPITPQGKRLTLPLPPAQRKLMKAQAAEAAGIAIAPQTSSPRLPSSSPRVRAATVTEQPSSHKRKAAFSPRATTQRRKRDTEGSNYGSSSEDEQNSHDHMYSDDEAPRLTHSRTHSRTSSRSTSPSRSSSSVGSQSPTHTELLSPHSYPASPGQSNQAYHLTPVQLGSSSIPPSPATHSTHYLPSMQLPPSSLGTGLIGVLSHGNAHASKTAHLRSPSPRVKQAACILLALSSENEIPQQQQQQQQHQQQHQQQYHHPDQHTSYTLTPMKQEVRPEQWIGGAVALPQHQLHWQAAH